MSLAVNVLIRNPQDDRVIPRFSRYLAESLDGWYVTARPDPAADAYYLSCYLEWSIMQPLPDRPVGAYFTHREENPVNGPKARLFDTIASLVDLRLVTAAMYAEMLADCGPVAQIPPPVERERFAPSPPQSPGGRVAGFSGYTYGNGRKGERLAADLVARKWPGVQWRASGRGWPVATARYRWAEMPAFYQSLDVLVVTASVEGVPMPALEALACGVSVVIPFGVGLLDELPTRPGIHRYKRGDGDDLAKAFGEAVLDRETVNREALRAMTEPYTIGNWCAGHQAAFEMLLRPAQQPEEPMEKVLTGRDDEIMTAVRRSWGEVDAVLKWVAKHIPYIKRQVAAYQGAILAYYAHTYNRPGARFLEIGTAIGYSACVMATAAPLARITTLNPKPGEFEKAVKNLYIRSNVRVVQKTSQEFGKEGGGELYDLIFVDGDHAYNMVLHDARFFNRLKPGGLILFHDYSPDGSARPSHGSFEALNYLQERQREFDVKVIGTGNVGLAGWIRQEGEKWDAD
jgi:predicted O-methyltransferase YrrM